MRLSANSIIASFSETNGDIQIVVSPRGLIIDAQGAVRDVTGTRHNHGLVAISYDVARELSDFLDHLDEPADPRQPSLWSNATFTQPVWRARRRAAA